MADRHYLTAQYSASIAAELFLHADAKPGTGINLENWDYCTVSDALSGWVGIMDLCVETAQALVTRLFAVAGEGEFFQTLERMFPKGGYLLYDFTATAARVMAREFEALCDDPHGVVLSAQDIADRTVELVRLHGMAAPEHVGDEPSAPDDAPRDPADTNRISQSGGEWLILDRPSSCPLYWARLKVKDHAVTALELVDPEFWTARAVYLLKWQYGLDPEDVGPDGLDWIKECAAARKGQTALDFVNEYAGRYELDMID